MTLEYLAISTVQHYSYCCNLARRTCRVGLPFFKSIVRQSVVEPAIDDNSRNKAQI